MKRSLCLLIKGSYEKQFGHIEVNGVSFSMKTYVHFMVSEAQERH